MIWFVYRTHYEGPLSKRVKRLKAPSVLAWFARNMEAAKKSKKPGDVYENELGGSIYGLDTFFEASKKENLPIPKSMRALEALFEEHLYAEGDIRVDAHTVRVQTDDDEVELPYFFFDDVAAKKRDRIAYLLLEDPKLPKKAGTGAFKPPRPIEALRPVGRGKGVTYACLLTFADSESVPGEVHAFRGVRMPELAAYLREVIPESKPSEWNKEFLDTWPLELRVLRAMVGRDDASIEPALRRCAKFPTMSAAEINSSYAGVGAWENAAKEFAALALARNTGGNPKKSIVDCSPHAALFCDHASKAFGFQQWILFDDLWASANKDLASSILRYGSQWDPFGSGDDDDDDD